MQCPNCGQPEQSCDYCGNERHCPYCDVCYACGGQPLRGEPGDPDLCNKPTVNDIYDAMALFLGKPDGPAAHASRMHTAEHLRKVCSREEINQMVGGALNLIDPNCP